VMVVIVPPHGVINGVANNRAPAEH
jgi:hypothetical protein